MKWVDWFATISSAPVHLYDVLHLMDDDVTEEVLERGQPATIKFEFIMSRDQRSFHYSREALIHYDQVAGFPRLDVLGNRPSGRPYPPLKQFKVYRSTLNGKTKPLPQKIADHICEMRIGELWRPGYYPDLRHQLPKTLQFPFIEGFSYQGKFFLYSNAFEFASQPC